MPGDLVIHERECILWQSITFDLCGNVLALGLEDFRASWSGGSSTVIAIYELQSSRKHMGTFAALLLTNGMLLYGYENDIFLFNDGEVIR